MAKSGKVAQIKISGAATAFIGEATTAVGNLTYQITAAAKRVLDRTITVNVHLFDANDSAEAGTTTTNIKMTAHGLVTGDLIINTSRSDTARLVTYVDDDNVSVTAITGQTDGDTIAKYPTEASTDYSSVNRLTGTITYGSAVARIIKVSSSYLPLTAAADAYQYAYTLGAGNEIITDFGQSHAYQTRLQTIKDITGSLASWGSTDSTFHDALIAGNPVVIEFWSDSSGTFDVKCWALLNSKAMSAAVDGVLEEPVDFEGTQDSDGNVVAFG